MRRLSAALLAALVLAPASPAFADLTGFIGTTSSPANRSAKGVALGVSLLVVGFEFELASTAESAREQAPLLRTALSYRHDVAVKSDLELRITLPNSGRNVNSAACDNG